MKKFTFLKTLVGGLIAAPTAIANATLKPAIPLKETDKRVLLQLYCDGKYQTSISYLFKYIKTGRYDVLCRAVQRLCLEGEFKGAKIEDCYIFTENLPSDFVSKCKFQYWQRFKLAETAQSNMYKINTV